MDKFLFIFIKYNVVGILGYLTLYCIYSFSIFFFLHFFHKMGNQVPNTMWDLTLIYFHENVHKKYIKYTSSTVVQQTTRFCLIVRELGNILKVLGSILINFNNNPKKKITVGLQLKNCSYTLYVWLITSFCKKK
jgi:hypothetical protein